ncbi:MAG: hypothetical protein ACREEM_19075 [Blastocatellia bacterium]
MIFKIASAFLFFFSFVLFSEITVRCQSKTVNIQTAYPIRLPGGRLPEAGITDAVDCNSPVHWDDKGNMHVFTSVRHPFRSTGTNFFNLSNPSVKTTILHRPGVEGGKWLEATHRDADGALYGWYHNEPPPPCSNNLHLSAPRIGAMFSRDEGLTWQDLGLVLEAPAGSLNCFTKNFYFAGGVGDFSVILDEEKKYFYFLFGTYNAQLDEQGISIARMRYEDRNNPIGAVWKWRNDAWNEPGLGGRVTPVFKVTQDWHGTAPDAWWGPSIHFNTYLNQYVIVMNRAIDTYWLQEGIYISFNADIADPRAWSDPDRLPIDPQARAYPQIIGLEKGETDKLLGRYGRLFLLGVSNWLIEFRQSNDDNPTDDDTLPFTPVRPSRSKSPSPDRQSVRPARPSFLTDLDKLSPVEVIPQSNPTSPARPERQIKTRSKLQR